MLVYTLVEMFFLSQKKKDESKATAAKNLKAKVDDGLQVERF